MKNPKTTSVLVGLGLVLGLAFVNKPLSLTTTFINNTGQAVGGLHIQYTGYTSPYSSFGQNPAYTFANVQTDGKGGVDLSSGTVVDGGSVQIIAFIRGSYFVGNVQKWWWTDGSGNLVGQTHNGCRNPDCTSP